MHLAQIIAQQQMAVGLVSAAVVGGLVYSLKALPIKLWLWLRSVLTVTLVVEGSDPMYEFLALWFARSGAAAKAKRLMLAPEFDYGLGEWKWLPTLGRGYHLAWFGGRPVFVHREVSDADGLAKLLGRGANQRFWIITLGRSQALIRRLIGEAEQIYNSDGRVRVYFWHEGSYRLADRRLPRSLDTVFMPAAQKARVLADIRTFADAREAYAQRGTPWRRGYLFEGPPGTGKTSMVFALASALDRDVYTVNLNNITSDAALMVAFNEVPPSGVLAIEDIDTVEITRDRELVAKEREQANAAGLPALIGKVSGGITLSGLLNAIDGVASREGRVMFMTSNHPDQLDPALLRPGRVDLREHIGKLDRDAAWQMFSAFRPSASLADFDRQIAPLLPMAAADLQNLLQSHGRAHLTPLPASSAA